MDRRRCRSSQGFRSRRSFFAPVKGTSSRSTAWSTSRVRSRYGRPGAAAHGVRRRADGGRRRIRVGDGQRLGGAMVMTGGGGVAGDCGKHQPLHRHPRSAGAGRAERSVADGAAGASGRRHEAALFVPHRRATAANDFWRGNQGGVGRGVPGDAMYGIGQHGDPDGDADGRGKLVFASVAAEMEVPLPADATDQVLFVIAPINTSVSRAGRRRGPADGRSAPRVPRRKYEARGRCGHTAVMRVRVGSRPRRGARARVFRGMRRR